MVDDTTGVRVIARHDIPAITTVEVEGAVFDLGEHRDFRRHAAMAGFIPENARLAVAWTRLDPGKSLAPHVHPIPSMIIVCQGEGRLLGELERPLAAGDIVLVPAGRSHGFSGSEPSGIVALSVQFEQSGLYERAEAPMVRPPSAADPLSELVAYSRRRLEAHVNTPYFQLLRGGLLRSPEARAVFLDLLQRWSATFQRLMLLRQATCVEPSFAEGFSRHLQEEIGHDRMLVPALGAGPRCRDAIVEATGEWFVAQMLTRDNAEKAALVHLVLEVSAHAFHSEAARAFQGEVHLAPYFSVHGEADDGHAELGEELLRDLAPEAQERLGAIVRDGWDMLEAMLDRMVVLIRRAAEAS
ncbi:cupin domain-containing protein [Sorangium sp. So ce131]|uniref:cupin domain-containing protein n=1 Tax=Sorangium sp. So ce131 TaxID=3133282 RepID=UPI003F634EC6